MEFYITNCLPNTKILLLGKVPNGMECTAVLIIETNLGSIHYGFIMNSSLSNRLFVPSGEKIDYNDTIKYVNHALFPYIQNICNGALFDYKKITEQFLDNIIPKLDVMLIKFYLQLYQLIDVHLPKTKKYLDKLLNE